MRREFWLNICPILITLSPAHTHRCMHTHTHTPAVQTCWGSPWQQAEVPISVVGDNFLCGKFTKDFGNLFSRPAESQVWFLVNLLLKCLWARECCTHFVHSMFLSVDCSFNASCISGKVQTLLLAVCMWVDYCCLHWWSWRDFRVRQQNTRCWMGVKTDWSWVYHHRLSDQLYLYRNSTNTEYCFEERYNIDRYKKQTAPSVSSLLCPFLLEINWPGPHFPKTF